MRRLPSERKAKEDEAIRQYEAEGRLTICEPCNCGSQIRHNNGGNYHMVIEIAKDSGADFIRRGDTCELTPDPEWERCEDAHAMIREYGDWL